MAASLAEFHAAIGYKYRDRQSKRLDLHALRRSDAAALKTTFNRRPAAPCFTCVDRPAKTGMPLTFHIAFFGNR
jgi:hypothetical protein